MDRTEKIVAAATVAIAAGSTALFVIQTRRAQNKTAKLNAKLANIKTVSTNANTLDN